MNEYVWPAVVALVAVLAFLRLRPPPRGAKQIVVRRLQKQVKALQAERKKLREEMLAEFEPLRAEVDKVMKKFPVELNKVVQAIANDVEALKGDWVSMNTKANLRKMVDESKKTG